VGAKMTSRVGQQFGNYHLIQRLGQGGFADVYLGRHVHLNTLAAVKILHAFISHKDKASFQAEARIIARLGHPHIVRVLDYGVQGTTPFLVMDYAPNGTLREKHPRNTQLPLSTIVSYVTQIASALQYAHGEKLIHRDVKPENMLLGQDAEVLLSDFGVALLAQSSRSQDIQEIAGTIIYMAPEQLQGKPRFASDQYALGIVVYEWLCGSPPFVGSFAEVATRHVLAPPPSLYEKTSTISPELEQVVRTALAKEPGQRFPSVQAFATALEHACGATQPLSLSTFPSYSSSVASSFNTLVAQSPSFLKPLVSSPENFPKPSQVPHYASISRRSHAQLLPFLKKVNAKGTPVRIAFIALAIFAMMALTVSGILLNAAIGPLHHKDDGQGNLPTLTLSINDASPGSTVNVTLKHFTPSTRVVLTHDIGEPISINGSTSITAGAQGGATFPLVIDTTWGPGFHLIVAEDVQSHLTASANVQITGEGVTNPEHLLLDTTSLDMGDDIVGANTIRSFMLANSGGGSISWSANSDVPWLLVAPSQGNFSQKEVISLAVQRFGLGPRDYHGSITITSNVSPPQHIEVDMTVRPLPPNAGPVLAVSPALMSFTATDGQPNSMQQTLTVSNPGSHLLNWSLASVQGLTCNWLSATYSAETVPPGDSTTLTVNVQSQCLLPGVYTGTLMFTATGAIDSSQAVNVSLVVQPHCGLVTSTGFLAFTVVAGQNTVANQPLSLNATASCAGTPTSWSSSSTASWLSITPGSGQLKGTASSVVTASVNAGGIASSSKPYYADLSFVFGQSTLTVLAQLTVQAAPPPSSPIMRASPLSLTFSSIQGKSGPTGQVVTITNNGHSPLNWHMTATPFPSFVWLAASPSGSTIAPRQSGQATINVNTAQLTPGNYVGQITLNGMDATGKPAPGSPQTIVVNLMVQPPCTLAPPSSSALTFNAVQGASANPAAQTVMFTGTGSCVWPVNWTASVARVANWLILIPTVGTVMGNDQSGSIVVGASITGLKAGTYSAKITIAASDATGGAVQGSPESFLVILMVLPP
jgi:serine/threonine protein kinase